MNGVLVRILGHEGQIMWKHMEKTAIHKPKREVLEESNPANTLTVYLTLVRSGLKFKFYHLSSM